MGLFQKDRHLAEPPERVVIGLPSRALHRHRLVFTSPERDECVQVASPVADDLRAFLDAEKPVNGGRW